MNYETAADQIISQMKDQTKGFPQLSAPQAECSFRCSARSALVMLIPLLATRRDEIEPVVARLALGFARLDSAESESALNA